MFNILVTGGSRGIGYHLAQLFARDKYGLILVSRKRADLEKVAKELKSKSQCPQITIIDKDLSKLGAAEELYDEIKNKHQLNIDFLVNNAGSGVRGKIWETNLQEDLKAIHLNIVSLVTLTKLILPDMIKRNSGRILMLGSSASSQPSPLLANYAATKAFIANYTDALIDELKETQVRATLLVPGPTDTVIFQFYLLLLEQSISRSICHLGILSTSRSK